MTATNSAWIANIIWGIADDAAAPARRGDGTVKTPISGIALGS